MPDMYDKLGEMLNEVLESGKIPHSEKQNINDQLQKTNILQHRRQEGSCSYY